MSKSYKRMRREKFEAMQGDTIDALVKGLDAIGKGQAVPAETIKMIADREKVKTDNPKLVKRK